VRGNPGRDRMRGELTAEYEPAVPALALARPAIVPTPDVVSVITVNFNAGTRLVECVRSVLDSKTPVEVLVVDNGSTDGSLEALRHAVGADPRVRILENGSNIGFSRANNRALAWAEGDYLLFLNPDCVIAPSVIGRMRAVMECSPEAGLAGCLVRNPDGSEQLTCRRDAPTLGRAFAHAFGLTRFRSGQEESNGCRRLPSSDPIEVEAISGAFMFARRSDIAAVGPLDEAYFLHCEDLDWCMRFRRAGRKVLFVPDASIVHYKGTCSRTRPVRTLWHMHRGMIRYYRKFLRPSHAAPLFWLVVAGVALRFVAMSGLAVLRRERLLG
jgi:GT2 family glycosyltransferase